MNTLKERQVAFRSLTEGMDTTTASGELLFHVFGALAQYERAMTKERVIFCGSLHLLCPAIKRI